jgi:hypothetical protein
MLDGPSMRTQHLHLDEPTSTQVINQPARISGIQEPEFSGTHSFCRFAEGWDPSFSKPFPPELFPRLTAFSVP